MYFMFLLFFFEIALRIMYTTKAECLSNPYLASTPRMSVQDKQYTFSIYV